MQGHQSEQYLENVRKVGVELRQLLSAVDLLVPVFPTPSHRQVRNAVNILLLRLNNENMCHILDTNFILCL